MLQVYKECITNHALKIIHMLSRSLLPYVEYNYNVCDDMCYKLMNSALLIMPSRTLSYVEYNRKWLQCMW